MTTSTDRKHALERYYEGFNSGNLDVIYEIVAPDHESHGTEGNDKTGPEHLWQWATDQIAAFPDLHITVNDWIIEDDRVVSRFTATGTHTGEPYAGIPTTGRHVEITGVAIDKFGDDKIVESWLLMEEMSMARQLGVFG
jgi:steroid delta-isomerase-like uncharacterized protein